VKLKSYFEEHDAEKQLLKHDRELHKKPQAAHLKHIPAYMQDPAMVGAALPRVSAWLWVGRARWCRRRTAV
jgi:hypothetical protein